MLPQPLRDIFDDILEAELDALPPDAMAVIQESAVIVEDEPDADLVASLGMTPAEGRDLCGLHDGIPETEQSVDDTYMLPTQIMLFRGPIIRLAGYENRRGKEINRDELVNQVRITLLHEIGHQFGMDEDDLTELGYD
ncbi:MAG: metallopeptidase family protein [Phycisphaeraceae bacterium]